MSKLLECKNIVKRYGKKTALDGLNLSLESGKIYGLLGPNASGKTTLIKLINSLLVQNEGEILVDGKAIGVESKMVISYLPDHTYINANKKVCWIIDYFDDFYSDFDKEKAYTMLKQLNISADESLKTLSKGTKEKVQLILVMARKAKLYILDEPIAGVDPAAREYILNTILANYNQESTILISTHLIADIENVLDEFFFIMNGKVIMNDTVDNVREEKGQSIDELFREVFRC